MILSEYMNPENIKNKTEENSFEEELTIIKDEIQIELMRDLGITPEDNEGAVEWITKYAEDFNAYIHEHSEVVKLWRVGDRESALQTLIQAEKKGFPHQDAA